MLFKPNGSIDLNNDATDVSEITMTRCKNFALDSQGNIVTRKGSVKVNTTAMGDTSVNHLAVQAGARYSFAGDDIYKTESSIVSGLKTAQWSSIQYNIFSDTGQQVFALNGTDRKRIDDSTVYEWGGDAPTVAPTMILGSNSNGTLTGTYSFIYTHVRKVGTTIVFESNPSPTSGEVDIVTGSIMGTITHPNDANVTHIRIYRTLLGGGSLWYYDQEIATGTTIDDYSVTHDWEITGAYITGDGAQITTNDSDNSRDYLFTWELDFLIASTGGTTIVDSGVTDIWYASDLADGSLGGLAATDHDRPPLGTYVLGPNYTGVSFIVKGKDLYYSLSKQPEYWPALYFIEVSTEQDPGIMTVFYNAQPYFLTKNKIYYIQGTGHGTFQSLDMRARTGCQSSQGAFTVDGHGIYHIGYDGLYLFAGGQDQKVTQQTLEPIFTGSDANGVPAASNLTTAWIIAFHNKLYFGYTSTGNDYPTNVIVTQLDEPRRVTYYSYPKEMRTISIDESNDRLLVGCNDGFIRQLETGTEDDGAAISWEVQSKDFTLQTRKHFPRWVKYDVDVADATSPSGVLLLNGTTHHTHVLSGSRDTTRRLMSEGNGERAAIRLTGSGVATVYAVESE